MRSIGRWMLAGLAMAAVMIAVLVRARVPAAPRAVSAEEIVEKAESAAGLTTAGLRSFEMVQVMTAPADVPRAVPGQSSPLTGEIRSETHVWYQAPNRWRYETTFTALPGPGPDPAPRITVADGEAIWSYDPREHVVQINAGTLPGPGIVGKQGDMSPFGGGDLSAVLSQVRACYDPVLAGDDMVAGRPAYVVDLGATRCPNASASAYNGVRTIWVDKETFFTLKSVTHETGGTRVVQTIEVTSIHYNPGLAGSLFTFVPPPGAIVHDFRPKPAPSGEQYQRQLDELAKELDFPLFVPRDVPAGLVPRAAHSDPMLGVELAHVPPAPAEDDTPTERDGIVVPEQRATYEIVATGPRAPTRRPSAATRAVCGPARTILPAAA